MIQMILATDKAGCIGKDGKLPFSLKADMQNFKRLTKGTICVMGRITFESLPKPLKDRTMVVCTRKAQGLEYLIDKQIWQTNSPIYWVSSWNETKTVSIIGGADIYKAFMPRVDKLIWTEVDCIVEGGDTFYTPDVRNFDLIETKSYQEKLLNYTINVYERERN